MNREERAKQFMPFDALKGLREELSARERAALRRDRRELFEEEAERLSASLLVLTRGKAIGVQFYDNGYDRSVSGEVLAVDTVFSRLSLLCDGERLVISFGDIYRLFDV